MTAVGKDDRSRVVQRASSGNSAVIWGNVRRGHANAARTSLGFTMITYRPPACGRRVRVADSRRDPLRRDPHSGQPSAIVGPDDNSSAARGRSIASITW